MPLISLGFRCTNELPQPGSRGDVDILVNNAGIGVPAGTAALANFPRPYSPYVAPGTVIFITARSLSMRLKLGSPG
jgi:NAD(P)-dependent dehydrogenase (short-subunit alcohol dehydrogenase family)